MLTKTTVKHELPLTEKEAVIDLLKTAIFDRNFHAFSVYTTADWSQNRALGQTPPRQFEVTMDYEEKHPLQPPAVPQLNEGGERVTGQGMAADDFPPPRRPL